MAKKTQHIAGSHIVHSQKPYELMLVFKPEILESALEKRLKEFEQYLNENEGEVILKDLWGKKDLVYPIKQFEQGIYVVYNLSLPNTFLKELDEHLRIHNDIMRFLLLSLKKGYHYKKPEEKPVEVAETKEEGKEKSEQPKKEVKTPSKEASPKNLDDKLKSILSEDASKS